MRPSSAGNENPFCENVPLRGATFPLAPTTVQGPNVWPLE